VATVLLKKAREMLEGKMKDKKVHMIL